MKLQNKSGSGRIFGRDEDCMEKRTEGMGAILLLQLQILGMGGNGRKLGSRTRRS